MLWLISKNDTRKWKTRVISEGSQRSKHPITRVIEGSFITENIPVSLLPPATKLGQGYVFTGVCDSVHRGGVCISACWDTTSPPWGQTPPRSRHPPGADTPRSRHPPGADTPPQEQTPPPPVQSMLGDTVNARAVRILLECNLVPIACNFQNGFCFCSTLSRALRA